jgi:hypothetical protein
MRLTMPKPPALPLLTLGLALTLTLALACAPGGEDGAGEAPAGERVESGDLGIALAGVPAGFEVETNEGEELVLVNTEDGGTVSFVMTPLQSSGVNLQARVWEEKERIEGMPSGEYRGQNELGGVPLGTTYTSRGRFENEAGEAVEEYRALLVHPTQNRTLILQGERDALGNRATVAAYPLSAAIRLHWLTAADHDLKPLKSSGFSQAQHLQSAADEIAAFLTGG